MILFRSTCAHKFVGNQQLYYYDWMPSIKYAIVNQNYLLSSLERLFAQLKCKLKTDRVRMHISL